MKKNWTYSLLILLIFEILFWGIGYFAFHYFITQVEEFRFENKEFIWYLLGARGLILLFVMSHFLKKRRMKKYASSSVLDKISKNDSWSKNGFRFSFLMLAISFFIIAWANPQFGKDEKKMKTSGIDMMVCLDVSNSMLAKDLSGNMNRLEVAKLAIKNLLRQLKGDRVGVVVFAGSAYNYIPITNDYEYIKLELLSINPGMMSTQGTAIGAAIETAMTSFEENKTNKAILVFTDGENHEDNAIKATKSATKKGVKIYTIGMGTNKSVPIPKGNGNQFHKDRNGNTVLTKLNEKMLKDIASRGNGEYVRAQRTKVDTERIIKDISGLEKTKFKEKTFLEYEDRFQWFLGIGLIFLLLNGFIYKYF
ncbi:MAG: VWA domain-containing protein [Flavobacteriales bacterium]